jgi:hypothetical protein
VNKSRWSIYDKDSGFAFAWFMIEHDAVNFLRSVEEESPEITFELVQETLGVVDPWDF